MGSQGRTRNYRRQYKISLLLNAIMALQLADQWSLSDYKLRQI